MIPVQYLAGFVDGEGYRGLARIRRDHRSPEYCLRLSVYNTNRRILEDIQRTTGGTMSGIDERQVGWKVSYALIWTNAADARLIRKIKPFLVVKSEQSRALLAFDRGIQAGHRLRDKAGRLLPLTPRDVRSRQAFYDRLKRMNRRGPESRRNFPTTPVPPRRATGSPRFAALPARVVRYRERLRRQIKDLNKRGPGGTTFE